MMLSNIHYRVNRTNLKNVKVVRDIICVIHLNVSTFLINKIVQRTTEELRKRKKLVIVKKEM